MSSAHPLAVVPAARYGHIQPHAAVTVETVIACGLGPARHEDWRPGFTEVWDLRFTPSVDIVPADVPRLLDLERETKEALTGSATIVLTPKPLLLFSIRFYAHLVKPLGRTVRGVESEEAAAVLLGVDALPNLQAA